MTAIALGYSHTCAVTTVDGVKCWGENYYGQLGNGYTWDSSTPFNVSGLSSGVTGIAAGDFHTCAVTTTGAVKCWGKNDDGQLGNSSVVNSLVPIEVSGLGSGMGSVAAGKYHTCALSTSGDLKCWGRNLSGQLGDDSTTNRLIPANVQGP